MEFPIQRTRTEWFNDEKPCQEAVLGSDDQWVIQIRSLEHLLDFADLYSGLTIAFDQHNGPVLQIPDGGN